VQSSTARLAMDAGQFGPARAALSAVESASRAALAEMRQLLGVLRAGGAGEYGPVPGLGDLPGALLAGPRPSTLGWQPLPMIMWACASGGWPHQRAIAPGYPASA
jgi:Histidine kinase